MNDWEPLDEINEPGLKVAQTFLNLDLFQIQNAGTRPVYNCTMKHGLIETNSVYIYAIAPLNIKAFH